NPLQAIMLHLDAIREHVDRKRRRNLEFVVEGLQRIARIVSRLLGLHHSERKSEDVDLNGLVDDVMGLVHNQLTINGTEVRLSLAEGLPRATGDAEQLHHVFLNLILNAAGGMEGGGILTVSSFAEEAFVCVEVTDTGPGIDEESLPYIFEPFFSTKGRAGTGLGLFVSHAIVSDHGGKVEVRSRVGEGTSIKVMLPAGGAKGAKGGKWPPEN
ncbi:MAG TPA: ATP-binding protein, partial [bacterium]|nr:ATP-binding protein [bacterium]